MSFSAEKQQNRRIQKYLWQKHKRSLRHF